MQKCAKFFAKTNLLQSFIFKQDFWTPQLHFQWYFQGLYVFSINFKKIENSLRFGVRPQPQPQPQPQRFCCGNRNRRAGYGPDTLNFGVIFWLLKPKLKKILMALTLTISTKFNCAKKNASKTSFFFFGFVASYISILPSMQSQVVHFFLFCINFVRRAEEQGLKQK